MSPRSARLLAAALAVSTATVAVLIGHGTAVTASDPGGSSPARALARHAATEVPVVARTPARPAPVRRSHRAVLPHRVPGHTALRLLGSRLPALARRNGMSVARLTGILRTDHTAWISAEGDLFFTEPSVSGTAAAQTIPAPAYPTSQTFALHSKPGSAHTIFLDLDGATVSGTGWNTSHGGSIADGAYTGFDLDGNPSTFSTGELGYIQEVWREVSEIYAPFDVDVTTQDPGAAAISRSSSSDTTYGTHVVITSDPAPRAAQCGSCLGVAYVGTFDDVDPTGYYQPAWVFAYSTGFDPMIIAQAAAHETGHTLGLSHDGTATQDYYGGTAAWGPIMGSSMNRAVSQFSQGEYAGADNHEDDLAVIQHTGLPLRPDDHPSTVASSEQLGQHPSYDVAGIIGTRNDVDTFAVTLPCTTTLSAAATGIGAQSALDLSLTVLDAAGNTVAASAPLSGYTGYPPVSTGMNASVSVPAASGTYYLVVDGTGNGSPLVGGWSDYGSLGQYTLTASGCDQQSPSASPTTQPSGTPTDDPTAPATPSDAPSTVSAPTTSPSTAPPTPTHRAPGAPRIATPISGNAGGIHTAVARWYDPLDVGSGPLLRYSVLALHYDSSGHYLNSYRSATLPATAHSVAMVLPIGHYRFRVETANAYGVSPWSAASSVAIAR